MSNIELTWIGGQMELKPVEYWISHKIVDARRWYAPWRRTRTEYYLESEFGRLGPFDTTSEIRMHAAAAGMSIRPHPL